jgi:hypothetical protein
MGFGGIEVTALGGAAGGLGVGVGTAPGWPVPGGPTLAHLAWQFVLAVCMQDG